MQPDNFFIFQNVMLLFVFIELWKVLLKNQWKNAYLLQTIDGMGCSCSSFYSFDSTLYKSCVYMIIYCIEHHSWILYNINVIYPLL